MQARLPHPDIPQPPGQTQVFHYSFYPDSYGFGIPLRAPPLDTSLAIPRATAASASGAEAVSRLKRITCGSMTLLASPCATTVDPPRT